MMRLALVVAAAGLVLGCAHARTVPLVAVDGPPAFTGATQVVLWDAASGARVGAIQSADSVAALVAFTARLTGGWTDGAATGREITATFYRNEARLGELTLASGAFEARVGGRVRHRAAGPEEAVAFATLAGVPVKHGPTRFGGAASRP